MRTRSCRLFARSPESGAHQGFELVSPIGQRRSKSPAPRRNRCRASSCSLPILLNRTRTPTRQSSIETRPLARAPARLGPGLDAGRLAFSGVMFRKSTRTRRCPPRRLPLWRPQGWLLGRDQTGASCRPVRSPRRATKRRPQPRTRLAAWSRDGGGQPSRRGQTRAGFSWQSESCTTVAEHVRTRSTRSVVPQRNEEEAAE